MPKPTFQPLRRPKSMSGVYYTIADKGKTQFELQIVD